MCEEALVGKSEERDIAFEDRWVELREKGLCELLAHRWSVFPSKPTTEAGERREYGDVGGRTHSELTTSL